MSSKVVLAVLAWYIGAVIYSTQVESNVAGKAAKACTASLSVASALQLVPYKLRVADLLPVVPTLNSQYNIAVEFFETDNRVTDRFSIQRVPSSEGKFVYEGETNWVGFR